MRNLGKGILIAVCLFLAIGLALQIEAREKKVSRKDVPGPVISAFEKA